MATNGHRNRSAGHRYERDEINLHKKYFHSIASTRSCNRKRDGEGIDICNDNEAEVGRLPLDISCKSSTKASLPYIKLLEEMVPSDRIKVVLHRKTGRSTSKKSKGLIFANQGAYAITDRDGYERFLQHIYAIQILRKKLPEVIEELDKNYGLNLLNIPQQIVL